VTPADNHISGDHPLTDPARDEFGYPALARHLAETLYSAPTDESLVIAIHGDWGLGKTTVLNFVQHYLENAPTETRPYIIKFNPWWFSGVDDLTMRYFDELQSTLQRTYRLRKAAAKVREFGNRLSNAPVPYGEYGATAIRVLTPREKKMDDVKGEVARSLRKLHQRLVVFIDDVDRLTAEEIRQMFRLIKALGDLPNTVYLAAFDKRVAVAALEHGQGVPGRHYLEKIVQLSVELPVPEEVLLKRALDNQLRRILAAIGSEFYDERQFINLWMSGLRYFFTTPRDVVRLTNALKLTYPAVAGEVNVADFVAIEALRVFTPSVWEAIRRSPQSFAGAHETSWARLSGSDPRDVEKQFHEEWLAALPNDEREFGPVLRELLPRLFPRLAGVINEGVSVAGLTSGQWDSTRRVCSPTAVDLFFRLAVPAGAIGRIEMREIINEAGDPAAYDARLHALAEQETPAGQRRVDLFLDQLLQYRDDPEVEPLIPTLVGVPLRIAGALTAGSGPKREHNDTAMSRLVTFLLVRAPERTRFETLVEVIEQADTLIVPVTQVARLDEDEGEGRSRQIEELVTREHRSRLQELALSRIRGAAAEGKLLDDQRVLYILYRWKKWAGDEVVHWMSTLVEDPQQLAKLLAASTTVVMSGTAGDWVSTSYLRLDPRVFDEFIDRTTLRTLVAHLADRTDLSPDEAQAVELYQEGVRLVDEGRDPTDHADWSTN
jgi:predicted KAP-like P-loop ATPase